MEELTCDPRTLQQISLGREKAICFFDLLFVLYILFNYTYMFYSFFENNTRRCIIGCIIQRCYSFYVLFNNTYVLFLGGHVFSRLEEHQKKASEDLAQEWASLSEAIIIRHLFTFVLSLLYLKRRAVIIFTVYRLSSL